MSKMMRNVLIIILVISLGFVITFIGYQYFRSKPVDTNTNLLKMDENQNIESESINSEKELRKEDNYNENEEKIDNEQNFNSQKETEEFVDEDSDTPQKLKAKEIAKDTWKKGGRSLDGINFGIASDNQGDGKYIVCVSDKVTTRAICFYIVDVNTGIVEEM